MKILQICNKVPFPPTDGGAIATFNHAKGFIHHGHDVTILAINTIKHFIDTSEIVEKINPVKLYSVKVDTTIRLSGLLKNLFFSSIPYNAERFINSEFKEKLTDLLKTNNFDIIQLEGLYLCPYIPVIRTHSKAIISFRAHNIEHEIWKRHIKQEQNPLKKVYLKILCKRLIKFEKKFINSYDILVPITEKDHQEFVKLGNSKPSFVSSTGWESEEVRANLINGCVRLYHIGSLDWIPNQEGLLWFFSECWPNIVRRFPDVQFHLAGRNAPDKFIQKIQLKNVFFHGQVDSARDFILKNNIMVVPLFAGSGMRIKIIENMAFSKAIVSTKIGAEGIDARNYKEIMIADTSSEFVNRIENLIEAPEKINEMGSNANAFIQKYFDNKAQCKELIDFYAENLENKNA